MKAFAQWAWRQAVWPNLLRPYLRNRGLVLSSSARDSLAFAIEAARAGGPVTGDVIGKTNAALNDVLCAELDGVRL